MATTRRVCVIGAGAAGLEAVRTLVAAGHAVECFERTDRPGGHWHTDYEALHLITPRGSTCFDGHPMPAHYPLFPSRDQVRDYLLGFARTHRLDQHIRYRVEVTGLAPTPHGWRVRTDTGEEYEYDAVVVANGHLWHPRLPAVAARFAGHAVHSGRYRNPADISGDRVLVVGAGNSGCDLAVDAVSAGKDVHVSVRRGQVFQPKTVFGRPRSELPGMARLPQRAAERVSRALVRVCVGDSSRYPGLPQPATPNLDRQPPVVNDLLLYWIQHGRITVRPGIAQIEGQRVTFADGSSASSTPSCGPPASRSACPSSTRRCCAGGTGSRCRPPR